MSDIDIGRFVLSTQSVQVGDIVRKIAHATRSQCEQEGIRLVVDVEPMAGSVLGDEDRLAQVVATLVYPDSDEEEKYLVKFENKTNYEVKLFVEVNDKPVGYILLADGEEAQLKGEYSEGDNIYIYNQMNARHKANYTISEYNIIFEIYNSEVTILEY